MVEFDYVLMKELSVSRNFVVAARTGRPAFFEAKVNAKMGGWFNASKSIVDLQANGGVTGLLSAHCMELVLPTTTDNGGHLTVGEFELVCADSTTVNPSVSMAWFQASGNGTALAHFQDVGSLFEMTGFAEGDGNIVSEGTGGGAPTVAGTVRIMIDGVAKYLCLASKAAVN